MRPELELLRRLSRARPLPHDIELCRTILVDGRRSFDWATFVDQAVRHRVTSLVARNIERYELDPIPATHGHLLRSTYVYNGQRNRRFWDELRTLLFEFERRGVVVLPRKGAYLAEHVYGDLAVRFMSDLDFFVKEADIPTAAGVLSDLGYSQGNHSRSRRQIAPLKRDIKVFWAINVAVLPAFKLLAGADPAVGYFRVELRRNLLEPASGRSFPMSDLFERAHAGTIAGEPCHVLSVEDMALDVTTHLYREATTLAAINSGKDLILSRFGDVAELLSTAPPDGGTFAKLACHYGLQDEVYYALWFTEAVWPNSVPQELLKSLEPDDRSYLRFVGKLDGQPEEWSEPFLDRLFRNDRADALRGESRMIR